MKNELLRSVSSQIENNCLILLPWISSPCRSSRRWPRQGGITRAAARAAPRAVERHHAREAARGEPRRAAFPPPGRAPRAFRGGPLAALLRRAPARAFRGGPRRAEERRAARRAAHRLAREHRGDAPAAGALALSPRLSRGAPRAGDGHYRRAGRKRPEWRRRGGVRRRAFTAQGLETRARRSARSWC